KSVDLLGLQFAIDIRQLAGFPVHIASEEALDNADDPRVAGEDDLGTRGLQSLGDEPGEALVVADAGDEGDLAAEVDRDHARALGRWVRAMASCVSAVIATKGQW